MPGKQNWGCLRWVFQRLLNVVWGWSWHLGISFHSGNVSLHRSVSRGTTRQRSGTHLRALLSLDLTFGSLLSFLPLGPWICYLSSPFISLCFNNFSMWFYLFFFNSTKGYTERWTIRHSIQSTLLQKNQKYKNVHKFRVKVLSDTITLRHKIIRLNFEL